MQVSAQNQKPLVNVIRVVAVKNGEMAGTWEFKKDTITVGRAPTADVRLDSKDISRVHCTLQIRPNGIYVVDGRSLNGTRVNGDRVGEAALTPRDLVQVGGFRFKAFVVARAEEDGEENTPAEDGPRVQLAAVPSADSAAANDPTSPSITLAPSAKKTAIDPLPASSELRSDDDDSTPDPLPPSSELKDDELIEKTPAHLPSFAAPPAASLAERVATPEPEPVAPAAPVKTKQKMARGNVLAIAFFLGSAMFFGVSVIGAGVLFWIVAG